MQKITITQSIKMEIPNLPTSRGSGVVCEKFAIFDIIEVLKNQLLV